MLTVLYIHDPYLPLHLCAASEAPVMPPPIPGQPGVPNLGSRRFIVQGNFSMSPPLWHWQQKEYGNDRVRRESFLMAYQDKMRGAPLMVVTEVTCIHQETPV